MEKKHIYITALHLYHGGAEMAICNLANGFAERGYPVTIWCVYKLCEPVYRLHPSVDVEYLTEDKPNRQEFLTALRKCHLLTAFWEGMRSVGILYRKNRVIMNKIKAVKAGVILSTRLEHNRILARYAQSGVLKIGQSHYGEHFDKRLAKWIGREYIYLDYFVLLTESLRVEAEKIMRKDCHCKCISIGNYLEDEVQKKLQAVKDVEREKIVLSVGRLSPEKGFERLICAWKKVSPNFPQWKLVIIGDGTERVKLEALAGEIRVTFTGNIAHDRVLELMKQGSVYAMTSYTEGFPYVLLEACNAELPVVAYDVPTGPGELVQDGETGFLVPDHAEDIYCARLEKLLRNPDLCQKMGKKGKKYVERFTKQNTLDQWEKLFY